MDYVFAVSIHPTVTVFQLCDRKCDININFERQMLKSGRETDPSQRDTARCAVNVNCTLKR